MNLSQKCYLGKGVALIWTVFSIPLDTYDGKPFRYSRSKGIVYSDGKDLKDSGGSTIPLTSEEEPLRWNTEDAVFEIKAKID